MRGYFLTDFGSPLWITRGVAHDTARPIIDHIDITTFCTDVVYTGWIVSMALVTMTCAQKHTVIRFKERVAIARISTTTSAMRCAWCHMEMDETKANHTDAENNPLIQRSFANHVTQKYNGQKKTSRRR
jgi:hypothetical protein